MPRVNPLPVPMTEKAVTGVPVFLTRGGASAVIAPLGAGLRRYARNGVELTESYGDDVIAPSACGLLLAPWPNRVAGGRWELDGTPQQLDITEVSRGNASHGLLRNTGYSVVERTDSSAVLTAEIFPQHGYPFHLSHEAAYSLTADGHLVVEQTLTNLGASRAPAALGAHPFLRLGEEDPAGLSLTVEAEAWLEADERLIPVAAHPVDAEHRLESRSLSGFSTDTAYTALTAAEAGEGQPAERIVRGTLRDGAGRSVTLWGDAETVRYLHVFVTDGLNGQDRSVALEPMTAPANALNSGEGLVWLEEGESLTMRWGITSDLDGHGPAARSA
ncbi:aldose 1-epimerase family protein [Arthrobacter sp. UM1]|uniref:aldose 1-epimerase family protein n=1 Tax=Arthrobacter sp. UM1 TaxID=2766776 RepID=UPI001CF629C5|nr:aldose 1-epimerase family protein [Arthrobacter sp. UM1]